MKNSFIKIISMFLCLSFMFLSSCAGNNSGNSSDSGNSEDAYASILTDKKFKRGFEVRGLGLPIYPEYAEEETYGTELYNPGYLFQYGKTDLDAPVWRIAQWASRYAFHNPAVTSFTDLGNEKYRYENKSKLLEVDTGTGDFSLGLWASECFVHGDRVWGQEWPHLLIERDIKKSPNSYVSDKSEIRLGVDVSLDYFKDKMTRTPELDVHAAQCLFYLYVSNFNETTNSFSDMLWFGLSLFDNRCEFTDTFAMGDEGSKESATGKYIYNAASSEYINADNNFFKDGKPYADADKTVSVDFDALPFIKTAFLKAQEDGFMKNSSYDNLYINGMYIGFEIPGTYDMQMTFRNLDIKVKYE